MVHLIPSIPSSSSCTSSEVIFVSSPVQLKTCVVISSVQVLPPTVKVIVPVGLVPGATLSDFQVSSEVTFARLDPVLYACRISSSVFTLVKSFASEADAR